MTENSEETAITVVENMKVDDETSIKNGDVHVPQAAAAHLENGDVKKLPAEEKPASTAKDISEVESANVAENEDEIPTQVEIEKVIDEVIKEEVEFTEIVENKENELKIIEEAEEGDNEIIRCFEIVQVDEKYIESKNDEIITLQEVTILPLREHTIPSSTKVHPKTQIVSWETRKTVFFYLFLFAFVAWIIGYYAFDTGLIPNDKK